MSFCWSCEGSGIIQNGIKCPWCSVPVYQYQDKKPIVFKFTGSDYSRELQKQRCKSCWNADGFNFHVPDEIWQKAVPVDLQNHVVCLMCFDKFAGQKGIKYTEHLSELWFFGDFSSLALTVREPCSNISDSER